MNPIGVMQVADSLLAGGLERVAVTLANNLPSGQFRVHLCATRTGGPLQQAIEPHVTCVLLHRRSHFDLRALRRLVAYIREHEIRLLHAHGTSLFISVLASRWRPWPKVLWHDHFGRYATQERPVWLYRAATRFVAGIISVNQPLAEWARRRLRAPADRVWYVPNCAREPRLGGSPVELPGRAGSRIICAANLRPEKGHRQLLEAMRRVLRQVPSAHLLLAGRADGEDYLGQLQSEMKQPDLAGHVTWLGSRSDLGAVLKGCDVGVLSSLSEGLPLALIEYGLVGLPTVATRIGQCPEVLDGGQVGRLVPPGEPEPLAEALVDLLQRPAERQRVGAAFRQWVSSHYTCEQIIPRICSIYQAVLP